MIDAPPPDNEMPKAEASREALSSRIQAHEPGLTALLSLTARACDSRSAGLALFDTRWRWWTSEASASESVAALGDALAEQARRSFVPIVQSGTVATAVLVGGQRVGALCAFDVPEGADPGDVGAALADSALILGEMLSVGIAEPVPLRRVERTAETEVGLVALLGAIPDLWFVFDAAGRYQRVSDENHPWLVRPFSAMQGRRMHEVLDADVAARGDAAIAAALATGQTQRLEYTLRRADGVQRSFEARITPMPGRQVLYLTRDLTELRQLEHDVLLMQRALDADAAVPIAVCDALAPDMPVLYVNRAFERLTGWPRAEVLGRNLRLLQCEATEQAALSALRVAIAQGLDCTVALTNRRRDGSTFINRMQLAPVHDTTGRVVQYIGVLEDSTERVLAAQRLQYSEDLYRSLASAISDGLIVVGADGRIVMANPAGSALLGVPAQALVGGGISRHGFQLLHEDGRPVSDADHPMRRVLRGLSGLSDAVYGLRNAQGQVRLISLNVQPLHREPQGRPVSCVVTFRDITQARLAEDALRDKRAAELANRAKSEFLSRVSHEMRTPLNAVIGFAQLLQRDAGVATPAKVSEYCALVLQAGEHLLALINELLDLQRVEEGRVTLELEPLGLDALLAGTLELMQPLARERGVGLRHLECPRSWILADAQRMRQVLMNIVSNSIKYNHRPTDAWVELSCRPIEGERVVIEVRDNGPGLSERQLERLFQPFERLGHEGSGVEGSGLGLVIARGLVEQMDGRLTLSSEPGAGTCAVIELPAAQPPEPPSVGPADIDPRETASAPAVMRLLYVEDNRINALLFEEALKTRSGIDLRIAGDGAEALELMSEWLPEVLVLDAHLPDMDGFELLGRLRTLPALANAPAFMCSADAMPDDIRRAQEAGFGGYWTKPIDIARIISDLDALASGTSRTAHR